jgi:polyphosphate kinase 2 (PPK2 family)
MNMAKKKKVIEREQHSPSNGKLKARDYNDELAKLHVELVKLQQWVVHKGMKICVVFEGRDGAGKAARVSRRRPVGSDRAREISNVPSALYSIPPGSRRSSDI